ncbi:unnamed protein product [Cyclocybe aegerita]|uniref:WW domain-containing protein n=1 Tax=Cyclocybe aegerita TaxID=1973307 RepID=A0A8S0XRT3_CYCAE|nr:unnamed protein product [Cyclocybe aegerita]
MSWPSSVNEANTRTADIVQESRVPPSRISNELPLGVEFAPTTPLKPNRFRHKDITPLFDPDQPVYLPSGPQGEAVFDLNDKLFATKVPDGWTEYIHPDGHQYFHHQRWGIVTEANVRDEQQSAQVQRLYHAVVKLWDHQKEQQEDLGDISQRSVEIYLSLLPESRYYLVRHRTQEVFWLHPVRVGEQILGGTDDHDEANYAILMRQQYYAHLNSFPCHTFVPQDGIKYLHGYLTYIGASDFTADVKTTPWDPPKARLLLKMLDGILNQGVDRSSNGFTTLFISRLLLAIYKNRVAHRQGTLSAMTSEQPIIEPSSSVLDSMVEALCFFDPETYERQLRKAVLTEIASPAEWHRVVGSLLAQWSKSNILATFVLAVNGFFLSRMDLSSTARTGGSCSTLFAIGSLVSGLHYVRKHRENTHLRPTEVSGYLQNVGKTPRAVRRLAIILSLPVVLLLWALLALACAVASYAFDPPRAIPAYVIPACVLLIICMLILESTRMFWNVFKEQRGRAAAADGDGEGE